MELELYFDIPEEFREKRTQKKNTISSTITCYTPELLNQLEDFPIAIMGIVDERNSSNTGVALSANIVRSHFYSLFNHNSSCKILELGNLINGKTLDDTYHALSDILDFLLLKNITPVVFGSSQDMMFPIAKALKKTIPQLVLSVIDSKIDVGEDAELHNLSTIQFIDKKVKPHKIQSIGSQSYLVASEDFDYIEKEYHSNFRLGKIREDLKKTEPLLRDSHLTVFDLSAIRQCDAPGNKYTSPNGLTGEESCQLAKYSGLSEKNKIFFVCEHNPIFDVNTQTGHLVAQLMWHFIDGYFTRKNDYPYDSLENLQKYVLNSDEFETNFVFYKSPKTDRWWIEIPNNDSKYLSYITACNYDDYLAACQNTVPTIYLQEKGRQTILTSK